MRRGSIGWLLGIGIAVGGSAAAVALALPWLPKPAAREAGRLDFAIWFTVVICIVIFSIVASVMLYSIFKFRARPDDLEDGPPIHGHAGLEIVWTIIPLLLVTAIGIMSAIVLSRNDALGKNVLRIHVTAQQFEWSFTYPNAKGLTTAVLMLPKGRSVLLTMTSKDVIHSFWVPQFGQKEDVVPGLHTTLHITPDRLGTYPVICVALCGLGHALMRTEAIVVTPAAYAKWLQTQTAAIASPSASVSGAAIFKDNGCGACHTLAAASATGKVGPDLDKLPAWAAQAKQPLEAFVKESIVSPNAYIQPGFPKSVMPQTFGTSLTKPELGALVQYLISSSKKG
jgi:cytochrome c oxidase subunit II